MSELLPSGAGAPEADAQHGTVPAYLSDQLAGRFTLVREDSSCPFCAAVKSRGALACFSCYGAELLRDAGGAELAVLESRERELAGNEASCEPPPVPVEVLPPPADVRGSRDVRVTLGRLMLATVAAGALLFVTVLALLFFMSGRQPRVVVVERGVETVEVEAPGAAPNGFGYEDRRTAALLFVKTLFDVDPETRRYDVVDALKMMHPEAAAQLARELKESGQLAREAREGVRAWWQREAVDFVGPDGLTVRLTGRQVVERAGVPKSFVPMVITVKLAADARGRTPENQNTGLQIVSFSSERVGGHSQ